MSIYPLNLFSPHQVEVLLYNGRVDNYAKDNIPVAYFVYAQNMNEWLISHINPDNPDIAFGISDLKENGIHIGEINLRDITEASIAGIGTRLDSGSFIATDYGLLDLDQPLSYYHKLSVERGCLFTGSPVQTEILKKIKSHARVYEYPDFKLRHPSP